MPYTPEGYDRSQRRLIASVGSAMLYHWQSTKTYTYEGMTYRPEWFDVEQHGQHIGGCNKLHLAWSNMLTTANESG